MALTGDQNLMAVVNNAGGWRQQRTLFSVADGLPGYGPGWQGEVVLTMIAFGEQLGFLQVKLEAW